MSAELEVVVRAGHPDFLDLPWSEPLEEWRSDRIVRMARGVSRHVVRFVAYDDRVYALKETDAASAEREYRMLLALREENLPARRAGRRRAVAGRGGEGTGRTARRSSPATSTTRCPTTTSSPAAGAPGCSTACWTAARC